MGDPTPTRLQSAPIGAEGGARRSNEDIHSIARELVAMAERLRLTANGPPTAALSKQIRETASALRRHDREDDRQTKVERKEANRALFGEMARHIYAIRRERTTIFEDAELFGEPAWDILLDLYVAFVEDKKVSVSSACIGSASPPTTGLRWLGVLADKGLIVREHDPADQRRVLVRLSPKGVDAMDAYFSCAIARF